MESKFFGNQIDLRIYLFIFVIFKYILFYIYIFKYILFYFI